MRGLLIGCAATRQRVWSGSSAAWGEGTSKWAEPERCRRGLGTFLAEHPFPPHVDATAKGCGRRSPRGGVARPRARVYPDWADELFSDRGGPSGRVGRGAVAVFALAGLLAGRALALGARGRGCPRGAEGAWSGPQPARAQGADLRWINPVPDSPVVYCLLGERLEGAIRREPERSLARVIEIWSGAHWTEWVGRGESRGLRESRACTVERRVGRGAGGKPTPGSGSACTPDFTSPPSRCNNPKDVGCGATGGVREYRSAPAWPHILIGRRPRVRFPPWAPLSYGELEMGPSSSACQGSARRSCCIPIVNMAARRM